MRKPKIAPNNIVLYPPYIIKMHIMYLNSHIQQEGVICFSIIKNIGARSKLIFSGKILVL
jgi:hypothetical protein